LHGYPREEAFAEEICCSLAIRKTPLRQTRAAYPRRHAPAASAKTRADASRSACRRAGRRRSRHDPKRPDPTRRVALTAEQGADGAPVSIEAQLRRAVVVREGGRGCQGLGERDSNSGKSNAPPVLGYAQSITEWANDQHWIDLPRFLPYPNPGQSGSTPPPPGTPTSLSLPFSSPLPTSTPLPPKPPHLPTCFSLLPHHSNGADKQADDLGHPAEQPSIHVFCRGSAGVRVLGERWGDVGKGGLKPGSRTWTNKQGEKRAMHLGQGSRTGRLRVQKHPYLPVTPEPAKETTTGNNHVRARRGH
jgi:hypothetical protein